MKKYKKDDYVLVLTGKDKGKKGKIIKILSNNYSLVENINMGKKNVKKNQNNNGGIKDINLPIHNSNLIHFSQKKNIKSKVKFSIDKKNIKQRILKLTNEELK